MKELFYTIKDTEGIHARPAGELIKEAKQFECRIMIEKDGKEADAKRILGVMGLGAKCGDTIRILFDGEDEEKAYGVIEQFMEKNL